MDISIERLRELEDAETKLKALEVGGVDNWSFYDEALSDYHKNKGIEEKKGILLEELEVILLEGAYEPSERGAGYSTTDECRSAAGIILNTFLSEIEEIKGRL